MTPKQYSVLISAHQTLYNAIEIIETIKITPEMAQRLGQVLELLDSTDAQLTRLAEIGEAR